MEEDLDLDLDLRTKVSMDEWRRVPLMTKGEGEEEYVLTVPDDMTCGICGKVVRDGETAWLRAVWEHGVQTLHRAYHVGCNPFPLYVPPVSRVRVRGEEGVEVDS